MRQDLGALAVDGRLVNGGLGRRYREETGSILHYQAVDSFRIFSGEGSTILRAIRVVISLLMHFLCGPGTPRVGCRRTESAQLGEAVWIC
jgi:hypothetical protein